MKKIFTMVVAMMAAVSVWAYDFPGFQWSAGCEFTNAYLWRGMRCGGMSFQPDVTVGYGGLNLEGWANIGSVDNSFHAINPELDLSLSYTFSALTVGVTHYHYFNGSKYFDYRNAIPEFTENGFVRLDEEGEPVWERRTTNQIEVFAKFELAELVEKIPLSVTWSTFVGGDDWRPLYRDEQNPDSITGFKRAFSSYLEFSYEAELPLGFTLIPTVGCTPWASSYNNYENKFSVNNISLKLNWELNVKDVMTLDVYGIAMLNTAGLNKHNFWPSAADSQYNQRFNLAAGVGIWFGNK